MNESLKQLSEETKKQLLESIASKDYADFLINIKSDKAEDSGSFNVVISTSDVDRQGDSVKQDGWDLSFYKMNPIVLWAHDYAMLPIGMATSIEIKDGKLIAEGKFAPAEANPFAQQVRKLYDLGMINTTSVGFIPKEYDGQKSSKLIAKAELLEFSFVPVPANPYALRLNQIKELGIDTEMLKVKGVEIKEVSEPVVNPVIEKGEVADELEEKKNTKWMKYRPVYDLMDALACAYFDESTPAEDFGKLVTEAADILKAIATNPETDQKAAIEKIKKSSSPLIIIASHVALGTLAEGKQNNKEIVVVNERSNNSKALLEVNDFVGTRELLRSIDNSVGKVLENFNKSARNR
jgi:HK97 family phage prohead protease